MKAMSYPTSEDWGWYLAYTTDKGTEFAVHCGNIDGSNDCWLLSLRKIPRKMFGRDKPDFSDAAALITALKQIVTSFASTSELSWLWDDKSEPRN